MSGAVPVGSPVSSAATGNPVQVQQPAAPSSPLQRFVDITANPTLKGLYPYVKAQFQDKPSFDRVRAAVGASLLALASLAKWYSHPYVAVGFGIVAAYTLLTSRVVRQVETDEFKAQSKAIDALFEGVVDMLKASTKAKQDAGINDLNGTDFSKEQNPEVATKKIADEFNDAYNTGKKPAGIWATLLGGNVSKYKDDESAKEYRHVLAAARDFLYLDPKSWNEQAIPVLIKKNLEAVRVAATTLMHGYNKPANEPANEAKGYLKVTVGEDKKLVVEAWQ